ncbi:MFS transporter [Streptomyces sp. NPDC102274]|uniref:MFS transporter n=1 Tax=Streptomyces sp. NPDC102274 TaxID=3366151 RepID=UPI0037FB5861
MLMIILDGSITTVALPSIQRDLDFTPSGLSWVVNAYVIAFGGLLLLAGRVGDLIGRKKMFTTGLGVFTAASAACGLAATPAMFIAARFAQGVGGAMVASVSLGMIATLFPQPAERAKAFGAFSFVGAGGASLGQVLGGTLTQALSWNWIFYINLPIGAVALTLALRVLSRESGPGLRAGVDILGAILVTSGLMLGVYAIVSAGAHGLVGTHTLGFAALAASLLAGFVLRQARAAQPLLPLRMFTSRTIAGANLVQTLLLAGLFAFQVLIALYMQNVQHYSAARTGLAMLPAALTIGAVSLFISARAIARLGERHTLLIGLALVATGIGLLTRLPAGSAHYATDLLPTMLAVGGFGLAITALTTLAMSDARPEDAGLASGLFNTTQQVGAAVGVAALTTLATSHSTALTAIGTNPATALTAGFHLAFATGAALTLAALIAAATILRTKPATTTTSAVEIPADAPEHHIHTGV